MRFLLIFAVVLGHCLEIFPYVPKGNFLYTVIYSFHMPAFLCLTGYFARRGFARMLRDWLLPYILFQILYILFVARISGGKADLQFTTPYWILWYLPAGCFYCLLLPLYDLPRGKQQYLALGLTLILAVVVGMFVKIGYALTLSRIFVFQPWFLLGYYLRKNSVPERINGWKPSHRRALSLFFAVGSLASVGILYVVRPPWMLLYGSVSYRALGYSAFARLGTMGISFLWIGFLWLCLRPLLCRRIPLVGRIGRNTLPVFLFHGFAIKLLAYKQPEFLNSPWLFLPVTCGLLLVLGQPLLTALLRGKLWKKTSSEET